MLLALQTVATPECCDIIRMFSDTVAICSTQPISSQDMGWKICEELCYQT